MQLPRLELSDIAEVIVMKEITQFAPAELQNVNHCISVES